MSEKWHVFIGGNFVKIAAEGYEEYVQAEGYLGGPLCIAEVNYKASEAHDPTPELAEKRAHVLAAAPELLDALKEAIRFCPCSLPQRYSGHLVGCFVPDAKQVIAKAEGRA